MSIRNISIVMLSTFLLLMYCVEKSMGLLCYNCSSTHSMKNQCAGEFGSGSRKFNSSRLYLVNCSEDNSMCFVRSWSSRAKHAWIVQRGCYHVDSIDSLPKSMDTPTRAMSCKLERLADAEYKICLCQADWCNTTACPSRHQIRIFQILAVCFYEKDCKKCVCQWDASVALAPDPHISFLQKSVNLNLHH